MKAIRKNVVKLTKLVSVKVLLAITACLLVLGSAGAARAYQNPVFDCVRDPDVDLIWFKNHYYMTRPAGGFYYSYESQDLVHWGGKTAIFQQPTGIGVWKGHMVADDAENLYLYYTQVTGTDTTVTKVASAREPNSLNWTTNYSFAIPNCIDPYLFKDDDGKLYFYYKHEVTGLDIWVQPMSSYTTASGSPTLLLTPFTSGWEACGEPQLEGTCAFKSGGVYYILYTGGYDDTSTCYGIGAAWSTSPTGPFTKCANNPFLSYRQNGNVLSAGAPRVVQDGGKKYWITYRTWPTPGTGDKKLSIDPLTVDNVNHELHATPTWGTTEPNPIPLPGVDDFDLDGIPDAVVINTNTNPMTWSVRLSSTGATNTFTWGSPGDVPFVVADLDGDGVADAVVYRPSNQTWYYHFSAGGSTSFVWGNSGDIPLMRWDFDGDGVPDPVNINTNTNPMGWNVRYSHDGSSHTFTWGSPGDIPFVAQDVDRDGLADAVVYRPSNQTFYYRNSSGGNSSFAWGSAGDIPLMSGICFDGNGVANAITISTNANPITWNVRYSHDGSSHTFTWGSPGDIPYAEGDYDGDGITDAVVYRPSNHTWYILKSGGGSTSYVFGDDSSIPVH